MLCFFLWLAGCKINVLPVYHISQLMLQGLAPDDRYCKPKALVWFHLALFKINCLQVLSGDLWCYHAVLNDDCCRLGFDHGSCIITRYLSHGAWHVLFWLQDVVGHWNLGIWCWCEQVTFGLGKVLEGCGFSLGSARCWQGFMNIVAGWKMK